MSRASRISQLQKFSYVIDELVKAKLNTTAIRLVIQLTKCTPKEAFSLVDCWQTIKAYLKEENK